MVVGIFYNQMEIELKCYHDTSKMADSCLHLVSFFWFRMLVDREIEHSNRWDHLGKLLNRNGPLAHPDFEHGPRVL